MNVYLIFFSITAGMQCLSKPNKLHLFALKANRRKKCRKNYNFEAMVLDWKF